MTQANAEVARRLFARHAAFVFRVLRNLGAAGADAEDLTQEVFVVALRKSAQIHDGSERAFLFGIARRTFLQHRRGRRRAAARDRVAHFPAADHDPEQTAMHRGEVDVVRRTLASLPEEQRLAFLLIDIEGMSGPEVATMTDAKLNTVYTRVAAARNAVRRELESRRAMGEAV